MTLRCRDGARRRSARKSGPIGAAVLAALILSVGAPAIAQSVSRGHDTSAPIEIYADQGGELDRERRVAIFRGNVDTIQGDIRMRTDVLTVHYDEANGGDGQGSVSRIDAQGNVFLSSPAETAQGDQGTYDVGAGTIVLTGGVVLTRGDNVIRGDRFEMDLNTGLSRILSKTERVRAIIQPTRPEKPGPAQ